MSPAACRLSPSLCGRMPCCDAGSPDAATLCVSRLSPCVSRVSCVSLLPDAVMPALGSCLPLVPLSPSLVSLRLRPDARCCAGSGACLPVSHSLCDAVTWLRVRVSRLSPCVSQSLRSDARCSDAGPACLPVSPSLISLCGRMLDAAMLDARCSRLSLVSQSLRSDARCCDIGTGVVSPTSVSVGSGIVSRLSPCVSQSLRCDAGSGVVTHAFRIQAIFLLEDVRRHQTEKCQQENM